MSLAATRSKPSHASAGFIIHAMGVASKRAKLSRASEEGDATSRTEDSGRPEAALTYGEALRLRVREIKKEDKEERATSPTEDSGGPETYGEALRRHVREMKKENKEECAKA